MNQKAMPAGRQGFVNNIIVVIAVVILAGAVGYFALINKKALLPETSGPQPTSTPTTQQADVGGEVFSSGDCDLISNSTFRSTNNQYEVGLGPNGPTTGYWQITFQGDKFDWNYSDVVEGGSYTCIDNVLQVKFFDRLITAIYDKNKEILVWDGIEYGRVEPQDETSVSPSLATPSDWQFIDKEFFTVNIPPGWQFNESQDIDSYTGELVGDGMRLSLDYGLYSDPLLVDEETHIVIYGHPSGRRAKFVVPNREVVGGGTTGVYFEELEGHGSNTFSLFGSELNTEQEDMATRIFWTLRFNWYDTTPSPKPDEPPKQKKE